MRKIKQILSTALAVVMLAGLVNVPAYAATKKISSISLVVENEIKVGSEHSESDITITTKSDKYMIGDVEIINDGYEWEATDTPRIEVYVEANDGYYLSVAASGVKLKGAEYVKGKKVDSKTILLTLDLPSLRETVGEIESVRWEDNRVAAWTEAYNTGYYEVKLYRNGASVKNSQKVQGTQLDLSNMMTKEGSYNFRVRAVNGSKEANKSEWIDSGEIYINDETAKELRETYGTITSGYSDPGAAINAQLKDGWNLDSTGWWYRNTDGSYTTNNWQFINEKWYYFNSKGYMQTGWIQWENQQYYCDDVNGDMLVNTTTPDGKRVDSAGVLIP